MNDRQSDLIKDVPQKCEKCGCEILNLNSMCVACAFKQAEPVGVEKFTALMVGESHGLIGPFGSDFKGSPEHYRRITVYTHPTQPVQPNCGACPGDGTVCRISCRLADESPSTQPVQPAGAQEPDAFIRVKSGKIVGQSVHDEMADGIYELRPWGKANQAPAAAINEQMLELLKWVDKYVHCAVGESIKAAIAAAEAAKKGGV